MRRLKTGRRPPIYPKTPGHLPCSSLTHPLPLPSRRPSVSFGGFGIRAKVSINQIPQESVRPPPRRTYLEKDGVQIELDDDGDEESDFIWRDGKWTIYVSPEELAKENPCSLDFTAEDTPTTPITSYVMEQPVTIDAGLLDKLSGEPELSGEIIITVKSIERAPNIEHNLYGKVEAEGVFVSISYSLVNEANSRIQPSTQINDNFVLADDRGRQWGTAGVDVAEAFADQMGESDPDKWVAPGFTGTTAIAFDVPDSASGLRLISTRLGIEVSLESPQ